MIPRGLSRREAARYIGISPSLFDQMVADNWMPAPKRICQLDAAFEALPSEEYENYDPFEDVTL
jgi:predicted DNA-binding transcriptional regulator AlpA